jgi:flagellar biosynthesis protein FlhB
MSDQPDKEGKTEQPSEKKLGDALEKGNVPVSNEPGILTSLLAILAVGTLIASNATWSMSQGLGGLLRNAAEINLVDGSEAFHVIVDQVWGAFVIMGPVLALIAVGGIVGTLAQNVPQANLERITPKAERLSPRSNFKRIFGKQVCQDTVEGYCCLDPRILGAVC